MNGNNNNNNTNNMMTASYHDGTNNSGGNPRILARNNSQSMIPLPRFTTTTTLTFSEANSGPTMGRAGVTGEAKWKAMFEEAEKKRKILVTQTQRNAREITEIQKREEKLVEENRETQRRLRDRESSLNELRRVSEAMYKEYDQLKNKYEAETGALHEAMKSATQWYKQNRVLKRQSTMMAQKFLTLAPTGTIDFETDTVDSLVDLAEKEDKELENLRKSVKDLSEEVGRLQAELNSARLEEFEAQEQAVNLASELDAERKLRVRLDGELADLRAMRDNLDTVSHMVATEMVALRSQSQQDQEAVKAMRIQADEAKKERNILAHQSSILLSDITSNNLQMRLLQEVESLKRDLEEEQRQHARQIQELQDKLEERDADAQMELMEEKLKLAESELQCALHRAERAETQSEELTSTVSRLEVELVKKQAPPPPPPPPPPPMPALAPAQPRKVPNAVLDMAKMLGVVHKQSSAMPQGDAINDVINQIKGGKFNLKTTEKTKEKRESTPVPPAVQEMLSILGTMKRRPKNNVAPADVAL